MLRSSGYRLQESIGQGMYARRCLTFGIILNIFPDEFPVVRYRCNLMGRDTRGGAMPKKRGKSISFDAMVKFFMQSYGIPTKKDVEKLMARMDRLEELIKDLAVSGGRSRTVRVNAAKTGAAAGGSAKTAADNVLDAIKASRNGIGFVDIKAQVGYDDKKLRNIIFRLNKTGKIRRVRRGIYVAG